MGVIFKNNVMYGAGDIEISPVCYSEEEREIGCWVDGKPLYEKTIDTGILTQDTSWHYIPHNIEDIDQIVSYAGIMCNNNYEFCVMPNYRPGISQGIALNVSLTNINYMQNWQTSCIGSHVTVRYTKTTDQSGSGTWTPQGVPAVHYSTDEQVVGTWIDRSTLYERTYSIASVPQSTSYSFENDASDIIPHSFNGVYTDDATRQIPNHVSSNPIVVYKYNNKLTIQNSSNHILTNVEITVRYTKTTS